MKLSACVLAGVLICWLLAPPGNQPVPARQPASPPVRLSVAVQFDDTAPDRPRYFWPRLRLVFRLDAGPLRLRRTFEIGESPGRRGRTRVPSRQHHEI